MQHTLTGSAIAKKSKYSVIRSFVFFCKSQTGPGPYLRTYNTMTSKKFYIHSEKVHAASFAFGCTGGFTIEFCHTGICTHTFGQCKTVIPVSGNKRIIGTACRHTSGCD